MSFDAEDWHSVFVAFLIVCMIADVIALIVVCHKCAPSSARVIITPTERIACSSVTLHAAFAEYVTTAGVRGTIYGSFRVEVPMEQEKAK